MAHGHNCWDWVATGRSAPLAVIRVGRPPDISAWAGEGRLGIGCCSHRGVLVGVGGATGQNQDSGCAEVTALSGRATGSVHGRVGRSLHSLD